MKPIQLKALLLEDSKSDALLLIREMKRGGFEVEYERIETAVGLNTALEKTKWDIILSDHSMPTFSAPEALTIIRQQKKLDTPFIIVSGTISEDIAVEAMKAGANDYFSKNKLARLVPAIERELQKSEERRRRRLAEQQLQKTEARFAKAFNASPVAIALTRLEDNEILSVNPGFIALFGYEQDEIIGKYGAELNLWTDAQQRRALVQTLHGSEAIKNVEVSLQHASGETVYALLSAEVIELDDEPCVLSFIQNITELKRRQEEILETKHLLEKIFASLGEAVFVVDPRTRTIVICNDAVKTVFGYEPEELVGQNTKVLHVNEEMYNQFKILGGFSLKSDERFHIEYQMRHKNGNIIFTENTVSLLDEEAGLPTRVVSVVKDITQKKESELRIQRANKRIKLLQDIAVTANEASTIEPVLQYAIEAVCSYTGWEIGHVFLGSQNGEEVLQSVPIWYLSNPELHDTFRQVTESSFAVADKGLTFKVWRTQKTQWLENVGSSPEFARREVAKQCGLRGGYAIPILAHYQIVGVLEFFSSQPPDEIARDVIEISIHIGSQVGRAVERQWATDKLRQYTERLELLRQVDQAILNSVHPGVIASSTLQQLKQLIPFYGASVVQFNYESDQATLLAIEIEDEHEFQVGDTMPMVPSPILEQLGKKRPYIVHSTDKATGLLDIERNITASHIKTYLAVPLISGDTLLGTLNLLSNEPNAFSEKTINVVMEVVAHLAVAIQNADLYQQVQQHANKLEQRVAERTAELQYQKERIETILRSSEDAILLLEQDGTILQANYSFRKIFGWEKGEVVGKPFSEAAHVADISLLDRAFQRVKEERKPQRIELTVCKPDGATFEVEALLSSVRSGQGEGQEFVCSLRDITIQKQIEEELRNALDKEKELNELKSSFTSMITHEFRTPLSIMKISTQTLIEYYDRLDESKRAEKLQLIDQQITRLTRLMDDVLLLGRGEQKGLSFDPDYIDLIALVDNVIEEVTTYQKGRIVSLECDEACHRAYVDKHLLLHILQNLVTNAFKYSPATSTVTVRLRCSAEAITLLVKDEGIGMPVDFQKNLFKMFNRANNVVEDYEGTGLGLAIVKRAVDSHGGTIEVESAEGKGTAVTVILPNLGS